jgi:Escherichia/Staphylococcus phage prohead protease
MLQVQRVKHRLTRKTMPARLSGLGVEGFEGYASIFGARDGIGDVVAPGAFAISLRRRSAGGVRMLYQHFAHEPIGVWEEIREDARGLYVRGRLVSEVERARDVAALLREGALGGLSIGFKTVRAKREPASATRTLIQVDLWEISVVTFPLLEEASVTGIGKENHALANEMRQMACALRAH